MSETDNFNADLNSGIAAYDSKNFVMAYQLLAPLATQGNPDSLWRVAMMQSYGLGMIENKQLGVKNFKKAAEFGNGTAQHMLGVAYMMGEGVDKNLSVAIEYFTSAVESGMQGAAFSLSMIYSDMLKDNAKAQHWGEIANAMEDK